MGKVLPVLWEEHAFGKILEHSSCRLWRRGHFLPGSQDSLEVGQGGGGVICQGFPGTEVQGLSEGYVSNCSDNGEIG